MADINDILVVVNKLSKRNYFIPSYQRGYRWGKQQVVELLDDILDFSENNKEQGDYYCLQPIVVKQMSSLEASHYELDTSDEKVWYEVIDGQQRITTLSLILHYFNEFFIGRKKLSEPNIQYETRETCIHDIYIDEDSNMPVCEGRDINSNIDLYHILRSYQNIHDWFSKFEDANTVYNKISKLADDMVKVIWYEITNSSEDGSGAIELFTRINMGKIPLTNAELIKALFLRKRNFESNKELRQIEIAKEWDNMEYTLQNDDFWYFLNKDGENKPARIEFLFDMMYRQEYNLAINQDEFNRKHGTDEYKTFRFFAEKFKKAENNAVKECWEEVQSCFSALKEWFEDPLYYHYIGYLITCGVSIVDIYNMYDDTPKDEFLAKIKNRIKEIVKKVHYAEVNGEVTMNLSYDNDGDLIRKLLLLFNIQYLIMHNSQSEHWYIRFPFNLYKTQKWDIEHINSFTTYEITKGEAQIEWLETAINDLLNVGKDIQTIDPNLYCDIETFKANTVNAKFAPLKARIAKYADEDETEDDKIKNNIGNLTLLNADINRGYGNSLFVTKRRTIIERDKEGRFIPICTKNIFLKYYDKEGSSKSIWSKANGDYNKYLTDLRDTLIEFITKEE